MTLIRCIGEALIDFLPLPGDGRTAGFGMHAGGSSLNVAVAAARLGRPAALAGKVSTDYFGRYLRAYVETEGVDVRWLIPADSPTTLAFVALESGDPVFSFYGQGAADTLLSEVDLPDALFQETTILQVGSISLLRGTTPGSVLAACQRMAGTALISLDPNVRPDLVARVSELAPPAGRTRRHRQGERGRSRLAGAPSLDGGSRGDAAGRGTGPDCGDAGEPPRAGPSRPPWRA